MGALPTAPRMARAHVGDVLAEWGLPHFQDTAVLVTSELVTNAVQQCHDASGSPAYASGHLPVIQLSLHSDRARLLISVYDQAPGIPAERHPDHSAETGRGLALISALGQWDWHPAHGGKIARPPDSGRMKATGITQAATHDPRLHVKIATDLRARLHAGDITAGTTLPITTLAQEWGASRETVRKALRTLENDGLIRRYPRSEADHRRRAPLRAQDAVTPPRPPSTPGTRGSNHMKNHIHGLYLHGVYSRVLPPTGAKSSAPRRPAPDRPALRPVNVKSQEKRQEAPIASGRENAPARRRPSIVNAAWPPSSETALTAPVRQPQAAAATPQQCPQAPASPRPEPAGDQGTGGLPAAPSQGRREAPSCSDAT
jgi:hypothetical protein